MYIDSTAFDTAASNCAHQNFCQIQLRALRQNAGRTCSACGRVKVECPDFGYALPSKAHSTVVLPDLSLRDQPRAFRHSSRQRRECHARTQHRKQRHCLHNMLQGQAWTLKTKMTHCYYDFITAIVSATELQTTNKCTIPTLLILINSSGLRIFSNRATGYVARLLVVQKTNPTHTISNMHTSNIQRTTTYRFFASYNHFHWGRQE